MNYQPAQVEVVYFEAEGIIATSNLIIVEDTYDK